MGTGEAILLRSREVAGEYLGDALLGCWRFRKPASGEPQAEHASLFLVLRELQNGQSKSLVISRCRSNQQYRIA
jgi:hypothetical protein